LVLEGAGNGHNALFANQGRCDETQSLHARALAIRERALGPEHPDVAMSLYSLGETYYKGDRYIAAEPLFEKALALWSACIRTRIIRTWPKVSMALRTCTCIRAVLRGWAADHPDLRAMRTAIGALRSAARDGQRSLNP
jgi:tetratricopeptide (TPR) repeat protein